MSSWASYVYIIDSVQPEYLWIVIVGGIFCWCAAWGIGANDTANAWGSTIGAKGISVRNAAIGAGIFEVVGAFALGANVGGTLKSKVVDPKLYCYDNYGLVTRMIGMLSVDFGSAIWLWLASQFGMPVSTTHAAVGGICGFGIITRGWGSVIWWETMGKIFISWVSSPLLAAFIGLVLQLTIRRLLFTGPPGSIFRKNHVWLPPIAGLFIGVAAVFAFYIGGKSNNGVKDLPAWMFGVTFGAVAAGMMTILTIVSWWLRKKQGIDLDAYKISTDKEGVQDDAEAGGGVETAFVGEPEDAPCPTPLGPSETEGFGAERETGAMPEPQGEVLSDPVAEDMTPGAPDAKEETESEMASKTKSELEVGTETKKPATFFHSTEMSDVDIYAGMSEEMIAAEQIWIPLCWVVAATESFAHGANDVGNAIGPYAAMIDSYNNACPKGTTDIPYWILGLGASGILTGLVTYGHRVVKTLGVDIAVITPQRAAASEMATVITVLIATALAIPVSTTHCAVGAITGMSMAKGLRHINWKTIGGVALCIFITVPCTALMTAAIFGFWQAAVFGGAFYPGPWAFNGYCNASKPGPWKGNVTPPVLRY